MAARVKQLEDLIRVQNQSYPQQSMNQLSGDQSTLSLPSAQLFSNPEQHSAVEEAAVAALGQLSKATSKEGGSEARICKACFKEKSGDFADSILYRQRSWECYRFCK